MEMTDGEFFADGALCRRIQAPRVEAIPAVFRCVVVKQLPIWRPERLVVEMIFGNPN